MGSKKVVLDTSVFVAGIIGHGASRSLLGMIIDCRVVPVLCREILEEYIRVVHYPKIAKNISISNVYLIIDAIHKKAEYIVYEGKIRVCRDPEDDKFVELSAKTSMPLVTLDKDILDLRDEEKLLKLDAKQVRILRLEEFLQDHNND